MHVFAISIWMKLAAPTSWMKVCTGPCSEASLTTFSLCSPLGWALENVLPIPLTCYGVFWVRHLVPEAASPEAVPSRFCPTSSVSLRKPRLLFVCLLMLDWGGGILPWSCPSCLALYSGLSLRFLAPSLCSGSVRPPTIRRSSAPKSVVVARRVPSSVLVTVSFCFYCKKVLIGKYHGIRLCTPLTLATVTWPQQEECSIILSVPEIRKGNQCFS